MPLSLQIAFRYLFGPKSTNVINLITGLSILGLTIGTAAILLVLSVFNGLELTLLELFNPFNPSLKVEKVEGKSFELDSDTYNALLEIPGVKAVSKTYEEIAFYQYRDQTVVAYIKGVDSNFVHVSDLPDHLIEGEFKLKDDEVYYGIAGLGIASKLGLNVYKMFEPVTAFAPGEQKGMGLNKPLREKFFYPGAVFSIQQDFDNKYIVTDLEMVQELMGDKNAITALELRTEASANVKKVQAAVQTLFGKEYAVLDQYQQEAEFFRLMNIEKWMGFVILMFVALLVAFNLVGAMWMIVLDKRKDIGILRAMGMTQKQIGNIFLWLGSLISGFSFLAGFIIALLLYSGQKYFGWVRVPDSFVMDAYPVDMRFTDVFISFIVVTVIGILASIPAMRRARRINFRENVN